MITIRDVARRAGVSVATVSRVINNRGKVSLRTRERVLMAMKELGFSPKPWAQFLAAPKRKFTAAIVVTDRIRREMTGSGFYRYVFEGIKEVAEQSGIRLREVEVGEGSSFDGYLLMGADFDGSTVKLYKSKGKPVVMVDHYIPGMNIDAVVSDGYGGAFKAVSKLIEMGHRRIVHIHNPLKAYSFRERYNGFFSAMEKYGLFPKVYEFDDMKDNMDAVIELMINTYGLPDAIFASNDFAAIRVYEELTKRDIRIPEEVSLIGFDDSIESERLGISSVRVYKEELGSFGMRRLITLMTGQDTHPAKISLFTELVIRGSVKNREGGSL